MCVSGGGRDVLLEVGHVFTFTYLGIYILDVKSKPSRNLFGKQHLGKIVFLPDCTPTPLESNWTFLQVCRRLSGHVGGFIWIVRR